MRKRLPTFQLVFALCVSLFAVSLAARARDEAIVARVTRQVDAVIAFFPAGSQAKPAALADSLIESKARNQLFRLEGLLRLYEEGVPDFKKYRLEVKELEDGLGAYTGDADALSYASDKFKAQNRTQPPSAAQKTEQDQILAKLTRQKETAHGVFATLVGKSTLPVELPKLRLLAASRLGGWNASKELSYVKGQFQAALKDAREGRFDFNKLEDGIHEYRRRLRWFPVQVDALDGLVLLRDDAPGACPVPAAEALKGTSTAKHRYSNPALRNAAANPCTISRCLLWQVVKTTNDLGDVKDEALGDVGIAQALDNDTYVPVKGAATPQEIAKAKTIRTDLLQSKALEELMTQISACK